MVRRRRWGEKKQVCIDPDSIIGKEIMYQTALLHEILYEIRRSRAFPKDINHRERNSERGEKK